MVVGRVQHLGDDLAHRALLKALYILALGKQVHIQRARAARVPKAEDIDLVAAVAGRIIAEPLNPLQPVRERSRDLRAEILHTVGVFLDGIPHGLQEGPDLPLALFHVFLRELHIIEEVIHEPAASALRGQERIVIVAEIVGRDLFHVRGEVRIVGIRAQLFGRRDDGEQIEIVHLVGESLFIPSCPHAERIVFAHLRFVRDHVAAKRRVIGILRHDAARLLDRLFVGDHRIQQYGIHAFVPHEPFDPRLFRRVQRAENVRGRGNAGRRRRNGKTGLRDPAVLLLERLLRPGFRSGHAVVFVQDRALFGNAHPHADIELLFVLLQIVRERFLGRGRIDNAFDLALRRIRRAAVAGGKAAHRKKQRAQQRNYFFHILPPSVLRFQMPDCLRFSSDSPEKSQKRHLSLDFTLSHAKRCVNTRFFTNRKILR